MEAGWALWSRKPGSRDDYSVLACSSAPFTRGEFSTIITRFAAGTPDARSGGPGELPWVTLSWVGVGAGLHLGIAITDDTGQVDGVGRPITRTSYFCVPYADAAAASLGYSALYRAVAGIELPLSDGLVFALDAPPMTAADAARSTERLFGGRKGIDERTAASTAALLLRGPVSVVQADGASLEERLEFLDAVAGLLPYGYRARLAAGTWADSGTRHRLRLAFATRARAEEEAVPWRRPAAMPSGADVAAEYFAEFCALRGMGPPGRRVVELHTVLTQLASDKEPRKFDQPQAAVDSLFQIDLPSRVESRIRDGKTVELGMLRAVVRDRIAQLEPDGRAVVLTELSKTGDAGDWQLLAPRLDDTLDANAITEVLGTFGQRVLWADKPDGGLVRDCLQTANRFGVKDGVLGVLLVPPDSMLGLPRAVECAADLLGEIVQGDSSGGGAYPRTREALGRAPRVVAACLAVLASSEAVAVSCLRWLGPEAPEVLADPFAVALGMSEGGVTESEVTRLAYQGTDCVSALVEAASRTERLSLVLPGCTQWVAAGGAVDEELAEVLRDLAGDIPPEGRPWLDLALLGAGFPPVGLPPVGQADGEDYLTSLVNIWGDLYRGRRTFGSDRCVRVLARYLDGQQWTTPKRQAASVVGLAERLRPYDGERVLEAAVEAGLLATPTARRWDFARPWLDRARAEDPGIRQERTLTALAQATPGTGADQLAALCRQAYQQAIPPEEVFTRLARAKAIASVQTAVDTMDRLRDEFLQAKVPDQVSRQWLTAYVAAFARGDFGETLARGLRERLWPRAQEDVKFNLALAFIFAAGASEQLELTERERDWLAGLRDELDGALKERKGLGRYVPRLKWTSG